MIFSPFSPYGSRQSILPPSLSSSCIPSLLVLQRFEISFACPFLLLVSFLLLLFPQELFYMGHPTTTRFCFIIALYLHLLEFWQEFINQLWQTHLLTICRSRTPSSSSIPVPTNSYRWRKNYLLIRKKHDHWRKKINPITDQGRHLHPVFQYPLTSGTTNCTKLTIN